MNWRYIPAVVGDVTTRRWGRFPTHFLDREADEAGGYYPHVLASAVHVKYPDRRLPPEVRLFGDSGGYQLLKEKADPSPVEVLRWQLRHAEEGPVLDLPPAREDLTFHQCLRVTRMHVRAAAPVYRSAREAGSDFQWLGACHGRSMSELQEWYDSLVEIHEFDHGWAFRPAPPGDPVALIRILRFVREREIRRLHVFVPGGPPCVAVLLVLGPEAGVESLTWDNTSPITSANNGEIYRPYPDRLSYGSLPGHTGYWNHPGWKHLLRECSCPSCGWFRREVQADPTLFPMRRFAKYRRRFHNVLAVLNTYEALAREAQRKPTKLLRKLLGSQRRQVMETFDGRPVPA